MEEVQRKYGVDIFSGMYLCLFEHFNYLHKILRLRLLSHVLIFRSYYDRNGDGFLGFEEFKNIIRDIRKSRGLADDPDAVQQETERTAR